MISSRNGVRGATLLVVALLAPAARTSQLPPWLPRYDLEATIDVAGHCVRARQRVTWSNRHRRPAQEMVFQAHAHYRVPDRQIGYLAKTMELIRMTPRESLDVQGEVLQIRKVFLEVEEPPSQTRLIEVPFEYSGDAGEHLRVPLPRAIGPGETVHLVLDLEVRLPQKMGRWGQWQGVTTLSNWLPVVAVYDDHGWHPTPFIPWHQPFYNEAGIYSARVILPADQKLACTGKITSITPLDGGLQRVEINAAGVRDFALLCSAGYEELTAEVEPLKGATPIKVRVLHLPGHEHYAKKMLEIACQALPVYSRWFGRYPWPEFTVAESFFGWNGNECSTLVMIDSRVFGMPHLACNYVDYLLSHEILHQWFYNLVGTNGYCETWMDEAVVTHFTHRLMTAKHGKNNTLLSYPKNLSWLPNIRRGDYRAYGMYGTFGRGENGPVVQEIPKFGHLANLFSLCYDKGSKIVGLIEERLGPTAMLDFMRLVVCRYRHSILHVSDFQRELEQYTGQSWEEFFRQWVHGSGVSDWAVEKVKVERTSWGRVVAQAIPGCEPGSGRKKSGPCRVTVTLCQKADIDEPTVLGIALEKQDCFDLRIPIHPQLPRLDVEEYGAVVESLGDHRLRVTVDLPCRPAQIAVDPDQVLVDKNPANNFWRVCPRIRFAPVYTFLEETDLTTAFDRWNILYGPWINSPAYPDPWYTRSPMIGVRAGLYRLQKFNGGVYAALRGDYRDVVAGADGLLDHWPWPKTQAGFNVEQRLLSLQDANDTAFRASAFFRYVLTYGSSLYLPPMQYVESFAAYQDNFLPFPRQRGVGAERYDSMTTAGIHYRVNYLTPYWDAEGGFQLDATYQAGAVDLIGEGSRTHHQVSGQLAMVKGLPDLTDLSPLAPGLFAWLADTRLAFRLYGAGGLPDRGEYFPLGGGTLLRGYDQRQRQGSLAWVGSVEWRLPVCQDVEYDICDHTLGVRNVNLALFYDAGNVYVRGRSVGPVAHAIGVGLRVDTAIFSFVERATLRLDVAKTVNDATPVQFWFGVQHPF